MSTSIQNKPMKKSAHIIIPQLNPEARLAALRGIFGMWKDRTPNPIKEQNKIRKEWDRVLPKR